MKFPGRDRRLNIWEWPAYLTDVYRVFPRAIFLTATFAMFKMGLWYMYTLPSAERTTEVSAFVAVCVGAWTKLMDYYMQRGNDWSKRLQINGGESYGSNTTSSDVSQS